MPQRRMFSPDIVKSEEFITMPISSQALYFHLGMDADDDGFIQPKITMRLLGANDDDLKVLLTKRFLLHFEGGVVVIKHWLIHNMIRADRHKPTRFQKEKNTLKIKGNKAYTDKNMLGCQDDNQMSAQVRLGKVRLGKVNMSPNGDGINKIFDIFYESINPSINYGNKTSRNATKWLIDKMGLDKTIGLAEYAITLHGVDFAPTITTPFQLKDKLSVLMAYYKKNKPKEIISI
jgi:hypothetical protein